MDETSTPLAPPTKKRRRPPVVCLQCRRRKVGCDRKRPCGQCYLNKTVCEYADGAPVGPPPAQTPRIGNGPSDVSSTGPSGAMGRGAAAAGAAAGGYGPSTATPGTDNEFAAALSSARDRLQSHATPASADSAQRRLSPQDVGGGPGRPIRPANPALRQGGPSNTRFQHQARIKGRLDKSRLFGESHWISGIVQFQELSELHHSSMFGKQSANWTLMDRCKKLARSIKAQRHKTQPPFNQFRQSVPPRDVAEQLVELYFRTFENVFRILHQPSFRRELDEYWQDPDAATEPFVMSFLLVMATGICFYRAPPGMDMHYQDLASYWIYAAAIWLNAPLGKHHMNVSGVQAHCLLLIAQHTAAIGGDLTWSAVGPLVRNAMSVGLHREPSFFPNMSTFTAQVRRRLWATVLELSLQSSLDSGMPALLSIEDFDCEPPDNLNDDQIRPDEDGPPPMRTPLDQYTQTTAQCLLMKSFPLRFRVVKGLNDLHKELSYDDTLKISQQLVEACRENSALFKGFLARSQSPEQTRLVKFQISLLDVLVRRVILLLHIPFAQRAYQLPAYYYSRKMCLDSSLLLLAYQQDACGPPVDSLDDFARLQVYGRSIFRNVSVQASTTICVELILALREDSAPPTSSLSHSELYRTVQSTVQLARRRVEAGETSVKVWVFFASALAQIQAMHDGTSGEQAVREASYRSLEQSVEILQARAARCGVSLAEDAGRGSNGTGNGADATAVAGAGTGAGTGAGSVQTNSTPGMASVDTGSLYGFTTTDLDLNFGLTGDWLYSQPGADFWF